MSDNKRYAKHKNSQTPAKWFKKKHNRKWKNNFKKQFNKWKNDNSYEIIDLTKATSAKWEW